MLTLTEQERRQKERLIEQLRKLGVEPDKKITGPQCPQCGKRGMMLTINEKNQQVRVCRSCGHTN